jgi:hypothetical protein
MIENTTAPHARQLHGVRVMVVDGHEDRMLLMDFLGQ